MERLCLPCVTIYLFRLVELRESVCHLMHVARKLHKKRQLAGALELEGTEVKIMIRNTGEDVTVEEILPKEVSCGFVCTYFILV